MDRVYGPCVGAQSSKPMDYKWHPGVNFSAKCICDWTRNCARVEQWLCNIVICFVILTADTFFSFFGGGLRGWVPCSQTLILAKMPPFSQKTQRSKKKVEISFSPIFDFDFVFVVTCGALYCLFLMSLYKHIIMSLTFFFLSKGLCNVELRLSLKFCGLCGTIVYIQELHYPWLLEFLQLELLPIFLLCLFAFIYSWVAAALWLL